MNKLSRSLLGDRIGGCNVKSNACAVKTAYFEQPLINVVKRSAVSTGQLNTSPCLHLPPIDLLVLQGPSSRTNSTHGLCVLTQQP